MTTSVRSALFTLFVALFLAIIFGTHAYAQSEGAQVKPALVEDSANPGDSFDFVLKVTNIGETQKTFYLSAEDITGIDDQGLPIFTTQGESTPYQISQWIQLPQSTITLAGGETKSISFVVHVPMNASPGSHFGGIFLDDKPQAQRANGSSVGIKIGSLIDLKIAGDINESATLREFSTNHIIYGSPSVNFNMKVVNDGNVLVRPTGLVEITDMRGAKVGIVKVNDTGAAVFPSADKSFTATWNYDGFAFGRYEAVASLVYGDQERKTISQVTSFWVLPLKPILIILGSIFAVILFLYVIVRMYINRRLREMGIGNRRADFYARRNQSAVPRLLITALAVVFFSILFLIILFFMFA